VAYRRHTVNSLAVTWPANLGLLSHKSHKQAPKHPSTALRFPSYSSGGELAIVHSVGSPHISWSIRVPIQDPDITNSSFIVDDPMELTDQIRREIGQVLSDLIIPFTLRVR